MDKFLTISQFGRNYKVSRSTIYRENKAGRLPFVKVGKATRIRESAAIAWSEALVVSGRV